MSKLNTFVTVHKDGEPFTFGPADDVPSWAEKAISNPNVWEEAPEAADETPTGADGEPPRAGAGSGLDVWKAYAADQGIEVPEDAKREDIFALVDAKKEQ